MRTLFIALVLVLSAAQVFSAQQSVVVETEGYTCMGADKSRKQTEEMAFVDAKRKAGESAVTYIQSETHVKDAVLEKDLLSSYANAQVKVIQELIKEWYREGGLGDCYRVKLKAEVTPDEASMARMAQKNQEAVESDPVAPLNVKIWSDRASYAEKDNMRIYLKGNKPFYGRVVYQQADGTLVQLLPNPYRHTNYFNGGVVYELPSGEDKYALEVSEPFGAEKLTLYASTAPGGDLSVEAADKVFLVRTKVKDIPVATRGIALKAGSGQKPVAAEFAEAFVEVRTGK